MQTVEVASVSEVPNNSYRGTCWLRILDPEVRDTFNHTKHALANKYILQQLFYGVVTDFETEEQKPNNRHQSSRRQQGTLGNEHFDFLNRRQR
jgi:hypothetical protein